MSNTRKQAFEQEMEAWLRWAAREYPDIAPLDLMADIAKANMARREIEEVTNCNGCNKPKGRRE